MQREELSNKISELVDCLRDSGATKFGLTDIASVTEVLIGTMESYFRSIDTEIYKEFKSLSDYLANARKEIAQLTPDDIKATRIPRAGQELDAIVQATEKATDTIMGSAEKIMAEAAGNETVEAACMQIFEACSFQDITGQRISKVVDTLQHIETRIDDLKEVWGLEHESSLLDGEDSDGPIGRQDGDVLLEGPALGGEGIDQDEVDALMTGKGDEAKATEAESEPEPEPEPGPEPEVVAETKADSPAEPVEEEASTIEEPPAAEDATAENGEPEKVVKAKKPVEAPESEEKEQASQADIDALFA